MALIGCSWAEADRLSGGANTQSLESDANLGKYLATLMGKEPSPSQQSTLEFLSEFRKLEDQGLGRHFVAYLEKRGYPRQSLPRLTERYNLRYAIKGAFAYRIILPVYSEEGLVNWTARTISKTADLRYRTLSADPEKAKASGLPVAPKSIQNTLWDFAALLQGAGEILFVTEGPFDALKLSFLGEPATCIFGTGNLSREQIILLDELAPKYDRKILLLDRGVEFTALEKLEQIRYLGFETARLPHGYEDPGELDRTGLNELRSSLGLKNRG